jgi:sporulation protein YlmC with PRC-barrel domain
MSQGINFLRAKSISGTPVENPQGENLGHIEDLVVDIDTGHVAYAVLSFGGFLGLGDKLFAIPLEALQFRSPTERGTAASNQLFILNIDKEQLKNAPGFDKDNWPNMADRSWGNDIYSYYGYQPYW